MINSKLNLQDLSKVLIKYGRFIYILELQDNCFYVGQATRIERVQEHFLGNGSSWTQLHSPINIVEAIPISCTDYKSAEIIENKIALEYMDKYGFKNVRGGFWCIVDKMEHIKSLRHHIDSLKQLNIKFIDENKHIFSKYEQIETCSEELKTITIYATGSCNTYTREGFYNISLEYKGAFKYLTKNISDSTVNRCIISGLIDAITLLKEPCKINVRTSTSLGITKFIQFKKSVNADLLENLFSKAKEQGSVLNFELKENNGQMIRHLATK